MKRRLASSRSSLSHIVSLKQSPNLFFGWTARSTRISLTFSDRFRIPGLRIWGRGPYWDGSYFPFDLFRIISKILAPRRPIKIVDGSTVVELLPPWSDTYSEELEIYAKYYLPVSVRNKTVLDVGAGCGETAYVYFRNGARKIICVEPEKLASEMLRRNVKRNLWNAEIISEPFTPSMLGRFSFDFMKMDCEGCEKLLLNLPAITFPAVIEVHDNSTARKFEKYFKARFLFRLDARTSLIAINC